MITNEHSYRVRTPDGKELYTRKESPEVAAEAAHDLLGAPFGTTVEVTDNGGSGKVMFFTLTEGFNGR